MGQPKTVTTRWRDRASMGQADGTDGTRLPCDNTALVLCEGCERTRMNFHACLCTPNSSARTFNLLKFALYPEEEEEVSQCLILVLAFVDFLGNHNK